MKISTVFVDVLLIELRAKPEVKSREKVRAERNGGAGRQLKLRELGRAGGGE